MPNPKFRIDNLMIQNEFEGLTPHPQSVFGINQRIVKSIMILVLSKKWYGLSVYTLRPYRQICPVFP
jgi:hypothetical protein